MSAKQVMTTLTVVTILLQVASRAQALDWYEPGDPQGTIELSDSLLPPDALSESAFNGQPFFFGNISMDVLLLNRTNANPQTIHRINAGNLPLVDAADLEFPLKTGFRVGLTLPSPCGCDFQFNYFGANENEASRTVSSPGTNYLFFQSAFVPAAPIPNTIRSLYESRLNSFEIGIRSRQWKRFSPIAGGRYIGLHEDFDRYTDLGTTLTQSTTKNDLWGFHVGLEGILWRSEFTRIESVIKGGIYANNIEIDGSILVTGVTQTIERQFSHSAFSGELEFTLVQELSPRMRIRVGYQVIWLEGVALGLDQNNSFNLATQEGDVSLDHVIYHGSSVGMEFTF